MKKIGIIDYQVGNLFSIRSAIASAGAHAEIVSSSDSLKSFDAAIFPGVGAFGEAMLKLRETYFEEAIRDFIKTGKPVLGICLGMQLLLDESEEFGIHKGLGIIPGTVKKFPKVVESKEVRVPQIGWNQVEKTEEGRKHPVISQVNDNTNFYFVHSYYASVKEEKFSVLKSEYGGITYTSAVSLENITAVQFHPEKSGNAGITLIRNWIQNY